MSTHVSVPRLSLLGLKCIRGFVSILRSINPTIIIIIMTDGQSAVVCSGITRRRRRTLMMPRMIQKKMSRSSPCSGGHLTSQGFFLATHPLIITRIFYSHIGLLDGYSFNCNITKQKICILLILCPYFKLIKTIFCSRGHLFQTNFTPVVN